MYNPEIEIYRGFWLLSWFMKEFGAAEAQEAEKLGCAPEKILDERIQRHPGGLRRAAAAALLDQRHPEAQFHGRGGGLFRFPHPLSPVPGHHRGHRPGAFHGAGHHGKTLRD
jgi:hypothetical protein